MQRAFAIARRAVPGPAGSKAKLCQRIGFWDILKPAIVG
jgi:hypothetical protein